MKILELKTENIKNLKAIEIKPDGNAVILSGPNGAGKSAILDSIFMALTGKKFKEPIRKGADRAEVNVDLGEYKVRKVWTGKGERLEVLSKDLTVFNKPQTMLDKILGDLSFDPLSFSKMKPAQQREFLMDLGGLNLDEVDAKRKKIYDERTYKNRELKNAELKIENLEGSKEWEDAPREEMSISVKLKELNDLQEKDRIYEQYCAKRAELEDLRAGLSIRLDEVDGLLLNLEEPENVTQDQIENAKKEISEAEETNKIVREAQELSLLMTDFKKAEKESEDLTKQLKSLDEDKIKLISLCEFPLPDLGINESCVLYKGIPFEQLSTGQQVRVSTEIAMALNPKLRVILVREGSLLDQEGLASIMAAAMENDYQLWIEKVDDSGSVGIHIENGEIVNKKEE